MCGAYAALGASTPDPTPPPRPENIEEKASQPKEIRPLCPRDLQIGPAFVPSGWASLGTLPMNVAQIKIDAKTQSIICFYTNNSGTAFSGYYISKKIPAGYVCTIPYPADYEAVCTRRAGKPDR